ncbi:MAG: pentapeptide repeat-containing protein [archaeon]
MVNMLTKMGGEELIRKILSGEKDFSFVKLKDGFNLNSHNRYGELQTYLKSQDLEENPLIISNAEMIYLQANGIFLPFLIGKKANLTGATLGNVSLLEANLAGANLEGAYLAKVDLEDANLSEANLSRVNLWKTNLAGSDLSNSKLLEAKILGTNLTEATLYGANLTKATLEGANLAGANLINAVFEGANLAGARNLEQAIDLKKARFSNTKISAGQEKILYCTYRDERFILQE